MIVIVWAGVGDDSGPSYLAARSDLPAGVGAGLAIGITSTLARDGASQGTLQLRRLTRKTAKRNRRVTAAPPGLARW